MYRFDALRKQKDRLHCMDPPQSAKQNFIKIIIIIIIHKDIHTYVGLPTKDETAKTVRSEIRCVCVYPLLDFYKVLKLI